MYNSVTIRACVSAGTVYKTLDALAEDFSPGDTIFFHEGIGIKKAAVVGFVYSLPLRRGGRKEPALVVEGGGHIYPHEVQRVMGFRKGTHFDIGKG